MLNHQRNVAKKWKEVYDKRKIQLKELKKKDGKGMETRKEKLKLRLEEMKLTKTWNLGTSLGSYIDPRVTVEFCQKVNYDWRLYYGKSKADNFAWAEKR